MLVFEVGTCPRLGDTTGHRYSGPESPGYYEYKILVIYWYWLDAKISPTEHKLCEKLHFQVKKRQMCQVAHLKNLVRMLKQ